MHTFPLATESQVYAASYTALWTALLRESTRIENARAAVRRVHAQNLQLVLSDWQTRNNNKGN